MAFSLPFFKPSPSALVRQLKDLPPTPAVLHKLQRLVASPDSTLEQIVEVVQLEQGLTARVMRMAQSAHFSRGCRRLAFSRRSSGSAWRACTSW